MDRYVILIMILLAVTWGAYLAGIFPYPFGWLVLTVLLFFRIRGRRRRD